MVSSWSKKKSWFCFCDFRGFSKQKINKTLKCDAFFTAEQSKIFKAAQI
jgi:hypothetical protein